MIRWCMIPETWYVIDVILVSHFGPSPWQPEKSKPWKNEKKKQKHMEIPSFYICVPKIMIRCCTVPEIWCMMDVITSHFGPFWAIFYPFTPPNSPKNQNFEKMKKNLEISSFYICVPKIMIRWFTVPDIWCAMDGWTDGQTEKVTYRGGCPT